MALSTQKFTWTGWPVLTNGFKCPKITTQIAGNFTLTGMIQMVHIALKAAAFAKKDTDGDMNGLVSVKK